MPEHHRVEELCFEVEFGTPDQAWQDQARLSAFVQDTALRVVDEEFGRALGDDLVLRIEALELDLGEIDADDMEAQWELRLRDRLQQALAALVASRPDHLPAAAATQAPEGGTSMAVASRAPAGARWHTRREADLQALAHFLQCGRWPWHQGSGPDPQALVDGLWRRDASAVVALLRRFDAPDAMLQRLVHQFAPLWLQQVEQALHRQADGIAADPARAAWPATPQAAQARLGAAWHAATARRGIVAHPPPRPMAPAIRGAQRRLKALLVDDAPALSEDDLAALIATWPTLLRDDPAALRDLLLDYGALASVRRRMARLWPEPLLQQVAGLWLPAPDRMAVVAAVEASDGPASAADGARRRDRWALLLRHLLAPGDPARVDSPKLLAALRAPPADLDPAHAGATPATDVAPPTTGPVAVRRFRALPADDPAQARADLRVLAGTWAAQRLLAAAMTRADLVRCLGWWVPAGNAQALGALAFEPWPAAWRSGAAGAPPNEATDVERRCQWTLQWLVGAGTDSLPAADGVRRWWQALALQRMIRPERLLDDLVAAAALPTRTPDGGERERAARWLRWLAPTQAAPAATLAAAAAPAQDAPAAPAARPRPGTPALAAAQRRDLATAMTRVDLARGLRVWLPDDEVQALLALVQQPWPAVWQRMAAGVDAATPHGLARETVLALLADEGRGLPSAGTVARACWQALGRRLGIAPQRLLGALRQALDMPDAGSGTATQDRARCAAWARWLAHETEGAPSARGSDRPETDDDVLPRLRSLDLASPAHARAGLCDLARPQERRHRLAAALTRAELVRCLGWWLPASEAAALGLLAFDPWPAVCEALPPNAATRCRIALDLLVDPPSDGLCAATVVHAWWLALAGGSAPDAERLRAALHARRDHAATPASERQRCARWAEWLDPQRQAPPGEATGATDDAARAIAARRHPAAVDAAEAPATGASAPVLLALAAAIDGGHWDRVSVLWDAARTSDPTPLRQHLRVLGARPQDLQAFASAMPAPMWTTLSELFLGHREAPAFAAGLALLRAAWPAPAMQASLATAALRWLLAGPGDALAAETAAGRRAADGLARLAAAVGRGQGRSAVSVLRPAVSARPLASAASDAEAAPALPIPAGGGVGLGARALFAALRDAEAGLDGEADVGGTGLSPTGSLAWSSRIQRARSRAGFDRLTAELQNGRWADAAADWSVLLRDERPALEAWVRWASEQSVWRRLLLERMPPTAWLQWVTLLLPGAPELACLADHLSRGQSPHVRPDLRERVLAWALDLPQPPPGGLGPAAMAALADLLARLARGGGASSHALAEQAASRLPDLTLAAALRAAAVPMAGPHTQAPSGGSVPPVLPQTRLTELLAGPRETARQALRAGFDDDRRRAELCTDLDAALARRLLALFLEDGPARQLAGLYAGLATQLRAEPGARDALPALARELLQPVLWLPPVDVPLLASHLLEWTGARLCVPVPVLAQRLRSQASGRDEPFALPDVTGPLPATVALDLPATAPGAQRVTRPSVTVRGAGLTDAERALLTGGLASLRAGGDTPLAPSEQASVMALTRLPGAEPRQRVAGVLESPAAAQRLARSVAPDALLRIVSWLRPADATTLAQVWPALQALAQAPPTGWPEVACQVLRELFEHDRPLHVQGLLDRTRAAQRPPPDPQAPEPLVQVDASLDAAPSAEPLFVGNAGLVLLAPYLPLLFARLDLLEDGKRFVDARAGERAVLLSQYLVTGEAACPEPRLLLNKLLCGLPLSAPVPRAIELAPAQREAADGLLLAVIAHWSALGRTSPAGLRQTFLQREGRLEHRIDDWQLEVPPQTFDVLLDRLPWGYATLRFPWMPEVLHVQWR